MARDVVVVGAGMLGSATALHLARLGARVRVIGPDVEQSRASGPGCSFDDRSRIVRAVGHDALWTRLCVESIRALRGHGEALFQPVGCESELAAVGEWMETARALGEVVELAPAPRWSSATPVVLEPGGGTLDPVALVRHRLNSAVALGGTVEAGVVTVEDGEWRADGQPIGAATVVCAAGAWSAGLLGLEGRAAVKTETTLWVSVPEEWLERHADRPGFIGHSAGDGWSGAYAAGPRRYPDGQVYVKLGADLETDRWLDAAGIDEWFREGPEPACERLLHDAARTIWPALEGREGHTHACAVTYSATGYPYIEEVRPGFWWVGPGCGYGAMASESLGLLGARAVLGRWPRSWPRARFTWMPGEPVRRPRNP